MTDSRRPRLAIVEDNQDLREELVFFLESRGHDVWGVDSAEVFWKKLHANPVDIVLLDLGLPGEDGLSMLSYLRGLGGYGLIVLTARGDREDRQRGLELGADLYRVKPVNFAQLAGDVAALWARLAPEPIPVPAVVPSPTAPAADVPRAWTLNAAASMLQGPGQAMLKLTPQEYTLLATLLRHPGEVHVKNALHDVLFGASAEADTHRVDVILSRLRQKAAQQGLRLPIRTVFGRGVAFVANDRE